VREAPHSAVTAAIKPALGWFEGARRLDHGLLSGFKVMGLCAHFLSASRIAFSRSMAVICDTLR